MNELRPGLQIPCIVGEETMLVDLIERRPDGSWLGLELDGGHTVVVPADAEATATAVDVAQAFERHLVRRRLVGVLAEDETLRHALARLLPGLLAEADEVTTLRRAVSP